MMANNAEPRWQKKKNTSTSSTTKKRIQDAPRTDYGLAPSCTKLGGTVTI